LVVLREREIEVRQQHAGEHRGATHHRQHEREVLAHLVADGGSHAADRRVDVAGRNDFFGVAENVEGFFAVHDV
jgi:hypothetical protein